MEIDLSSLRKVEVLLTVITTAVALVYGWLLLRFRTEFAAARTVDSLAHRVDTLEQRTGTIEGAVNHLPTREDTHNLALALADKLAQKRLRFAARLMDGRVAVTEEGMPETIPVAGHRGHLTAHAELWASPMVHSLASQG